MTSGTGTCTVTYDQAGDANYTAPPQVTNTTLAQPASQTITFATLPDKHFGDPDFTVSATAASGLAVSFTGSGNCTISGAIIHITGVGSCTITAHQAGDANYAAATDVPQTFTITDNTPPTTSITDGPQGSLTNDRNPSFSFTGTDDVTATANLTFECTLNGGAFVPCTSPQLYTSLVLGTHTFAVQAIDAAGNTDLAPATFTWTIGAVTVAAFNVDEDFKRFDGFDFVLGNGTGASLKIKSTTPGTFHHQITIANNTGTTIDAAHGTTATTILTVPGTPSGPSACGFVTCSTFPGVSPNPAFAVRGHHTDHVWPDDHTDTMPVSVQYMTLAQYQTNGNSCDVGPSAAYSSTLPADGAAKCVKITGFAIPVQHKARVRVNFESRLKGTDGWDATAKERLFLSFLFESKTAIIFESSAQTATTADGIIGTGSKMAAVGGFVLNRAGTPQADLTVRVFNQASQVSCTDNTHLKAQDVTDANGFYFIYRTGTNQNTWASPNLPSGVRYAVQLCNGTVQAGPVQTLDHRLGEKEFAEIDFDLP